MPFMAHTMEPLKAVVHPLAVYAWGHWVGHLTVSAMSSMGFTQHTSKTTGFKCFILRRDNPLLLSRLGQGQGQGQRGEQRRYQGTRCVSLSTVSGWASPRTWSSSTS